MRALRFIAAAAIAFAIWWYATPVYNDLLCRVLRMFGAFVEPAGRSVQAMRAGFTNTRVPADQLTYNLVLFAGLAAAVPPRVWRLLVGIVVIVAFHVVALAVLVESTFTKSEPWIALDFLYRIGGMFAIAFVCWYAATTPAAAREPRPGTSRKSERAKPARRRVAATSR